MNYGFLEPVIKEEDFILGDANVPEENLKPSGQWDDIDDEQSQNTGGVETYNCTGEGWSHAIAIYMKAKFFFNNVYSPRYVGIMAGTKPPGNDPNAVGEVIRTKSGCVDESLMPFIQGMSVSDYYSPNPPPPNVLAQGKNWIKNYYLRHEWVITPQTQGDRNQIMMAAIKNSPLPCAVNAWTLTGDKYIRTGADSHWVTIRGYKTPQKT